MTERRSLRPTHPPRRRTASRLAVPLPALAALTALVALAACGRSAPAPSSASAPAEGKAASGTTASVPDSPPAWTYPAPVSGHFKEINTGDFDLVDGIAFPARDRSQGTVIFVTAKSIASPILAKSACAATQARALKLLRNSAYAEVTLDAKGRAPHFVFGTPYDGTGRGTDVGGGEWSGRIELGGGRAKGSVKHKHYGSWDYDLAVSPTAPTEVSEDDRMEAGYASWGGDAPTPSETEALGAYGMVWRAVMDNDLAKYLELQGFDAEAIRSIRGLAGIDDDFRAHRDRFLDPGAPEEPTLAAGFAAVGARGTNSKGEAFANYYEFTPCGGKLVLTNIALNPQ